VNDHSIPSMHAEIKNSVQSHKTSFTLYPSLSPYRQTDRISDGGTKTLAAGGLEDLFPQLCCCVSVWFWQEIVLVLHTYVLRVQYSCGVVLVFWFWWEIVFGVTYVLSVQYSCAVGQFLVDAGNSS
jgi:hypothetical protein